MRATRSSRRSTWPQGVRIAVNFTADFDTMLLRRLLNEPPQQLAKGEFGGRVGIWRLIELFDSHDIKATIFTPGRICELYPRAVKAAAEERPRDRRPHVGAPGPQGARARARPSAQDQRRRSRRRPASGRSARAAGTAASCCSSKASSTSRTTRSTICRTSCQRAGRLEADRSTCRSTTPSTTRCSSASPGSTARTARSA